MDDRELLDLAAKAAGFVVTEERGYSLPWTVKRDGKSFPWNPLEDDGDALRLAVKLNMAIKQDDPNSAIAGWTNLQRINITHSKQGPWYWKEWLRDNGDDRSSATRRAIVRAAAEIGKSIS